MMMLEIITGSTGGSYLYISQNCVRILDSEVAQEAAAVFPEFEVGYLDQVLHQGSRKLAPQTGRVHNGEADGLSHPGNEFLPRLVITRPGAETDDVFQGQGRISHRSRVYIFVPKEKPAKGILLPARKSSGVKVSPPLFAHWQPADLSAPAQFQTRPRLLPAKYGSRRQR